MNQLKTSLIVTTAKKKQCHQYHQLSQKASQNSKKPAPKGKCNETDDNEEEPPKHAKMNKGKARVVMVSETESKEEDQSMTDIDPPLTSACQGPSCKDSWAQNYQEELNELWQDKATKKAADKVAKKHAAMTTPTTAQPVPDVPTTTSSSKLTNPKGKAAPKSSSTTKTTTGSKPTKISKPTTSSKLTTLSKLTTSSKPAAASKTTTSKITTKSNKTTSTVNSTETATVQKSTTAERQAAHEAKKAAAAEKAAGVSSEHVVNNPTSAPDQATSMSSTTISCCPNLKGLKLATCTEKEDLVDEFNLSHKARSLILTSKPNQK
ncbi:hypothetical protein FRC06_001115, partial [Ceratobasidium sp. 370]